MSYQKGIQRLENIKVPSGRTTDRARTSVEGGAFGLSIRMTLDVVY
jgi:hypothetical protein